MTHPRVLFLLKRRDQKFYDVGSGHYSTSSGLLNSATFVVDMLTASGIDAALAQVVDNNCIDREVTQYKPTHVVIEALWVVPEKFKVLQRLHPTVKWIIRIHSELPFLANEGVAMEWFYQYLTYDNVVVAPNSLRTTRDLRHLAAARYPSWNNVGAERKVVWLPNSYALDVVTPSPKNDKDAHIINVGCFGAIRPLKNQLIQTAAAVEYARTHKKHLRFHINGDRLEQRGDAVIKNIRRLFAALPDQYQLVEHPWYRHEEFLAVVRQMDIGLQLSLTETFNIVAADFVNCGIPMVTSSEINWISTLYQATPTDVTDIIDKMARALWVKRHLPFVDLNRSNLEKYLKTTKKTWTTYLTH
jgi:hypothetical protein